ncbi:MATE family efflux transporter [Paracoccus siganidrum]|uniref:MATE family efflux transporter n=1 Tax=Paracoccus siganidrum TaxID=1276757 RepID=A0A418ZS99_9RHOB|nr:MATE family efflux transporter [Paracoccus siganidrum]RJL00150.1 MATE family efflux transporter [Paracoccus siganidrum]RMC35962.1 MATE family efflux transporter [Paracoccus siganidrum]
MTPLPDEITNRRVLRIALPILLSNATIPLLGLVDTAVIGQLGSAPAIGAVAMGAVILSSIYLLFGFLRMGTSGLAAQAWGRGEPQAVSTVLYRALIIAALAGLALILLQAPIMAGTFALAPASDQVETGARTYIGIRIWGAPATISIYAITGLLIALERTRAVLALQIWINMVNILLDLWFVLGLGWGVAGIAAATLVAEYSGLALGLWFCRAHFAPHLRATWTELLDRAELRVMMAMNVDLIIRALLLQFSFTSFVFLSAGLGDVKLAANQVLMQFMHLIAYVLDGFAFAAEALVGQAVGAKALHRLRRAASLSGQWALGGALLLSVALLLGGPSLIRLMTTSPEVQAEAMRYLPWLAVAPIASVASYIFDGIFVGATMTRQMRQAMLISVLLYGATIALLLPVWGNHALWAALIVMNVSRSITMALRYPLAEARLREPAEAMRRDGG